MVDLFVRALIITAIIVAVTDAIVFYVIWSGKAQITPLFVILVIVITMIPIAINLWVHIFRQRSFAPMARLGAIFKWLFLEAQPVRALVFGPP